MENSIETALWIDNFFQDKISVERVESSKMSTHYVPHSSLYITDKRTDVWSRDFMIWRINFGLWAVAWAGLWEKRVRADYEQL